MIFESKRTLEQRSCLVKVRVQPGAQKTEAKGLMSDGSMKVSLKAAPVEGRANAELVAFLARFFKVPASSVRIVGGVRSRQKNVVIEGINKAGAAEIMKRAFE
jgi:uncharacterized protein (TIGR00251 family)